MSNYNNNENKTSPISTLIVSLTLILAGLFLTFSFYKEYNYIHKKNLEYKNKFIEDNNLRDYEWESYCDSIWDNDKDYYLDVLMETSKYQDYIYEHGKWWE